MNEKDIIINFYKDKVNCKPDLDLSGIRAMKSIDLTTLNIGLGDAIITSSVTNDDSKDIVVASANKHWQTLKKFNRKFAIEARSPKMMPLERLEMFNVGNGHLAQRLQRALGINIERIPKPYLIPTKEVSQKKYKIGLHFTTGPSAWDLLASGFQLPRQLEESGKEEILKFIDTSNYEFIEFGGKKTIFHDKVQDFTKKSIEDTLNEIASCEYFIGLNSGFMSAAAAFNVKGIIVVNAPKVEHLYLPILVTWKVEDMNWLYPQNVHLHQNGENELVPKLTKDNIQKAIDGNIYPYWKTDYLDLVFEYEMAS